MRPRDGKVQAGFHREAVENGTKCYAAGSDSKYKYRRQLGSADPIIRIMCREVCKLNDRGSRCSFISVNSCSN
jgi:hypothetical protein